VFRPRFDTSRLNTALNLSVDDGNGEYIIPASKVLNHDLVDRPRRGGAGPISPERPYQSGQKYMTMTERKEWELWQKKRKVKRHIFPDINVGDIARIRGKLKEWSRRNGEVIREVVIDLNENSTCELLRYLRLATITYARSSSGYPLGGIPSSTGRRTTQARCILDTFQSESLRGDARTCCTDFVPGSANTVTSIGSKFDMAGKCHSIASDRVRPKQ
jgi:hypothetical protein